MSFPVDRRSVLLSVAALPLLQLPALADEKGYATEDVVVGDEAAPLVVYEYISYTCPACANFHRSIWPQVKENYVDTGKVKFVVRDFYRNTPDLLVGMTARCGGPKGFYPMADVYLSTQATWTRAPDVNDAVRQIARKAGLSNTRIDACLTDEEYARTLVDSFRANMETHGVRSTPTFIVNGDRHEGFSSYEDFAKVLDAAL